MSSTYSVILPPRTAYTTRQTKETTISLALSLDGGLLNDLIPADSPLHRTLTPSAHHAAQYNSTQTIYIDTGIGFLDHMLHALAKHSGWSLHLLCRGDLASYLPHSHSHSHPHIPDQANTLQSTTTTQPKTPPCYLGAPSPPHCAPSPA